MIVHLNYSFSQNTSTFKPDSKGTSNIVMTVEMLHVKEIIWQFGMWGPEVMHGAVFLTLLLGTLLA